MIKITTLEDLPRPDFFDFVFAVDYVDRNGDTICQPLHIKKYSDEPDIYFTIDGYKFIVRENGDVIPYHCEAVVLEVF